MQLLTCTSYVPMFTSPIKYSVTTNTFSENSTKPIFNYKDTLGFHIIPLNLHSSISRDFYYLCDNNWHSCSLANLYFANIAITTHSVLIYIAGPSIISFSGKLSSFQLNSVLTNSSKLLCTSENTSVLGCLHFCL